ncbi:MAG: hypothetical protein J0H55_08395 [Chitinophagaceae bacterium]|nr:hypothetical protein [Chitinophagaceae bacterium]
MNQETYPLHQAQKTIMSAIAIAPKILSEEGLSIFLDGFKQQGWLGAGGMERWPARKPSLCTRAYGTSVAPFNFYPAFAI